MTLLSDAVSLRRLVLACDTMDVPATSVPKVVLHMLWKRGGLTPELADLVFSFLPLDLSVADEDDVLVYWKGATYKTCDARFIGRDIRDCHPDESMACLEEILRAFKAGEKDIAEGWHEDKGKFKRTRYIALRDHDGVYRGILEVNEDVTSARALEGEQALPGW